MLDRLKRIEALRRAQASPAVILREVRSLLAEGEAWLAAERAGAEAAGTGRTEHALAELDQALASRAVDAREKEVMPGQPET